MPYLIVHDLTPRRPASWWVRALRVSSAAVLRIASRVEAWSWAR